MKTTKNGAISGVILLASGRRHGASEQPSNHPQTTLFLVRHREVPHQSPRRSGSASRGPAWHARASRRRAARSRLGQRGGAFHRVGLSAEMTVAAPTDSAIMISEGKHACGPRKIENAGRNAAQIAISTSDCLFACGALHSIHHSRRSARTNATIRPILTGASRERVGRAITPMKSDVLLVVE